MRIVFLLFLILAQNSSAQSKGLTFAKPVDAGMDARLLDKAVNQYRLAIKRDEVRGAVILVARKKKIVVYDALGWKDKANKAPLSRDAMFRMASNTKPVIATAAGILVDRGKLSFDDPVSRYLSSFDQPQSRLITVHHLLTHTSGFRIKPIFFKPLLQKSPQNPSAPSLQGEVARFGKVGPAVPVGTSYSYSNAGFNTLGAIIEVISGQPLETFLQEAIYRPLEMKDTYHHEVARKLGDKLNRMSVVYYQREGRWIEGWRPGQPPQYPFVRASGGMISTAIDYARFCQMYLDGGIFAGRKVLRANTVKQLTRPHTAELYSAEEKKTRIHFYGYGWRVHVDGTFSHSGSDGTAAWVDPSRELIVLVLTQSPGDRQLPNKFYELVRQAVQSEIPRD